MNPVPPRQPVLAPGIGGLPRQPLRPTPDQRTALRLLSTPPVIPAATDLAVNRTAEQSRRQLLLQAQDALHETSVWTQELFTPMQAPAPDASLNGDAEIRTRLAEARDRAEKRREEQTEAHSVLVRELREGAALLSDDLARQKRPVATDDLASELLSAKRHREAPAAAGPATVTSVPPNLAPIGAKEPSSGMVPL